MNILTPEDIEWKYVKHITYTTFSHTLYRNETFKIQMEVKTKRDGHGWVGSSKEFYFIDDCPIEFRNIKDLCNKWNELKNYDEETTEIKWIQVVKQKPQVTLKQ